jgi:hypothetical protein
MCSRNSHEQRWVTNDLLYVALAEYSNLDAQCWFIIIGSPRMNPFGGQSELCNW